MDIEDFDLSLLKIDKKPFKSIGVENIGYITIKNVDNYENINSINPFYLVIHEVIEHIKVKMKMETF